MAGSAGKAQYEVPPGQAHEVPAQLVLALRLGSPRLARKPLSPHLATPCHPRFSKKNSR